MSVRDPRGLMLVNVATPKLMPDHLTTLRGARATPTTGWSEPLVGSSAAGQPSPDKSRRAHPMSGTPESRESDTALQTTPEENVAYVGLLTRVISWAVDVLLINLVAIITGSAPS